LVALAVAVSGGVAVVASGGDAPADERYQTSTLVVARRLTIRAEQLPRLAETVFSAGSVADGVSRFLDGAVAPRDLVPERIEVDPVLGTIAVRVLGRGPDGAAAAALADEAARLFVLELNQAGEGVGNFAIQDRATVPDRPEDDATSLVSSAGLVLACGLVAGLGLVGLRLTLRSPVIDGLEAAATAGAPLLGVVRMRRRGRVKPAGSLAGFNAVSRRLLPTPGEVALVGTGGDRGTSDKLAVHLAELVGRRFPCRLVRPLEPARQPGDAPDAEAGAAVISLSGEDVDAPQYLSGWVRPVLVVAEGTPRSVVGRVAAQFLPGELDGVVYVHRSPRSGPVAAVALTPGPAGTVPTRASVPGELIAVVVAVTGDAEAYLPVGGARFTVHGADGATTAPIARLVCGDDGQSEPVLLDRGRYQLVQQTAAAGYEVGGTRTFVVAGVDEDPALVVEIANRAERGRVLIRPQQPASGDGEPQAVLLEYDPDNRGRWVVVAERVLLPGAPVLFDQLLPGSYRVVDLLRGHADVVVEPGRTGVVDPPGPRGGGAAGDVDGTAPEAPPPAEVHGGERGGEPAA
jgi:hypothetical protein